MNEQPEEVPQPAEAEAEFAGISPYQEFASPYARLLGDFLRSRARMVQYLAEQLGRTHRLVVENRSAVTRALEDAGVIGLVQEDPVQEIAAHPTTLARFAAALPEATPPARPSVGDLLGEPLIPLMGLPLVPDEQVSLGTLHLRPIPHRTTS